jgi:hypothetical protein
VPLASAFTARRPDLLASAPSGKPTFITFAAHSDTLEECREYTI